MKEKQEKYINKLEMAIRELTSTLQVISDISKRERFLIINEYAEYSLKKYIL